jgi:hypothetical protein
MLETTPKVRAASVLVGLIFAYLTATGGKLIGIGTSKEAALRALRTAAENRRLLGKLNQFHIRWDEKAFVVSNLDESRSIRPPPDDLFS